MKISLSLCFFFLMNCTPINAQVNILWEQNYGGSKGEHFNNIKRTIDGGYIVIGHSESGDMDLNGNFGERDIWLVKIDSLGEMEWSKNYGGSRWDPAYDVIPLENGYLIGARSESNDFQVPMIQGSFDIWLLRVDLQGEIIWSKTYGSTGFEGISKIIPTESNGFLVTGYTNTPSGDVTTVYGENDIWIFEIDSLGNLLWEKNMGGSKSEHWSDFERAANGEYFFCTYSESNDFDFLSNSNSYDAWIGRMNNNGHIIWTQNLYSAEGSFDMANAIEQTLDGGYILVGATSFTNNGNTTLVNKGGFDYWVVKTDSIGQMMWQKNYGGTSNEYANSVVLLDNGGYLVSGISYSQDGDITDSKGSQDIWIIQLDSSGELVWEYSIGGGDVDGATLKQVDTASFLLVGFSNSDTGDIENNYGQSDGWIALLNIDTSFNPVNINVLLEQDTPIEVFPNPTQSSLNLVHSLGQSISFQLIDYTGQTVLEGFSDVPNYQMDLSDLENGAYFLVKKIGGEKAQITKIIKIEK
ncbi:MAG: T9SS type A sorting domain-containing protein [Chitinophagales bacterium]